MTGLLKISDLHAEIEIQDEKKPILHGVNLEVPPGEIHVIMGPNGSGKSTLSKVLAGRDEYHVTKGQVTFGKDDLLSMEPEERAAGGVFLAFQSPVELPGVNNANFLRTALNSVRRARGEEEMDAMNFLKTVRAYAKQLHMSPEMLKRNVNVGFSGGEKKRNEVLQMLLLKPSMAILDETDSGLDVDALKTVAHGIQHMCSPKFSAIVITHHQKLLEYLEPQHVHVMLKGKIVASGGIELARDIDKDGFGYFEGKRD